MNAVKLYVSIARLIESGQYNYPICKEINNTFPNLEQSLSCTVCRNLLTDPYSPTESSCQHHVCKTCIGSRKRLRPSCSWCKDYTKYVKNTQIQCLLECYKGLCEYIKYTNLFAQFTDICPVNNDSDKNLLSIIQRGADLPFYGKEIKVESKYLKLSEINSKSRAFISNEFIDNQFKNEFNRPVSNSEDYIETSDVIYEDNVVNNDINESKFVQIIPLKIRIGQNSQQFSNVLSGQDKNVLSSLSPNTVKIKTISPKLRISEAKIEPETSRINTREDYESMILEKNLNNKPIYSVTFTGTKSKLILKRRTSTPVREVNCDKTYIVEDSVTCNNTRKMQKLQKKTIITGDNCSFKQIQESGGFVDKSMLIADVIEAEYGTLLITCPKRFGKSTNLQMLGDFLSIKLNDKGEEDLIKKLEYENLFKSLKIGKKSGIMSNHYGKLPVIFVNFLNIKSNSFDEIVQTIANVVKSAFRAHRYLETSKKLASDQIDLFKDYLKYDEHTFSYKIKWGLLRLTELLFCHHNRKVCVLIDEYDSPLQTAMSKNDIDIRRVNDFLDALLCATLKNNKYLKIGIITGISGIVKTPLDSSFNNFEHKEFLGEHKFVKYYGFHNTEVRELLDKFEMSNRFEALKAWCNGYQVPPNKFILEQGIEIYNPWSVLLFIKNEKSKPESYWCRSGSIQFVPRIFKFDEVRNCIETLVKGFPLQFQLNTKHQIEDVKTLKGLLIGIPSDRSKAIQLIFSDLFEKGFLSRHENQKNHYKIPNKEIKSEFIKNLLDFYILTYTLNPDDLEAASKALKALIISDNDNNQRTFQSILNESFKKMKFSEFSKLNSGLIPNEELYHSIINAIALQDPDIQFDTEIWQKGKKGRGDIVLALNDKDKKIVAVIEVKHGSSVEKALKQAKCYSGIIKDISVKPDFIKYIGINIERDLKQDLFVQVRSDNNEKNVEQIPVPHSICNQYYSAEEYVSTYDNTRYRKSKSRSIVNPDRPNCRCGNATLKPGKLTCCGQRCACYMQSKACSGCRCRGCRNPHMIDGVKILGRFTKDDQQEPNVIIDTSSFQDINTNFLNHQLNQIITDPLL